MYNFENSTVSIVYISDFNAIHYIWKLPNETNKFRESLIVGLYLVERTKASNWFFDFRSIGLIDKKDQIWLANKWFQKAIELGIKRMAIISSGDIMEKLVFDKMTFEDRNCTARFFSDETAAIDWLQMQTD